MTTQSARGPWAIRWTLNYEGRQYVSVHGARPEYDRDDKWNGNVMNRWAEVEVIPRTAAERLAHAISVSLEHGEQGALADALKAYLAEYPWSDL